MQVANKITYYNKAMSAIVVNNDSGQDPLNKSRVQVYIPELHGMKDTYTKYQEYVAASDKPNRDDFTAYPWAFNTVSDVNNGDTVYVMNLSNYIGSFVVIGRDASCKSGTGGSDSDLSAGGLAELIIPFTIHHECYVHITDSSCHTEGYATVKGHDPLYKCVGWDSNIPDIVLAVYTTSTSGSWSVGLLNWDASRAYKLIFEIASRDSSWKSKFTNTNNSFVSHLERDVQTGNCSTFPEVYQTGRTSEPSIIKGIQAMLTSSIGREVQISTCRKDVTDYVQGFLDSGISNPAIVMYMADLCNQWGSASPFLEAMRSAAKDPSSIMGSVSKEVEIAIKNYPNANQMMKEVEAIHAYWMGPLHTKYGMNRYAPRRNECIAYIRELFKQGKFSQFSAGMTMLGNLNQATYKGITLAYPFESEIAENQTFTGNAWNGRNAYVMTCTMRMPKSYPITSLFGARKLGITHRHMGVDFSGPEGVVLYASHDGELKIVNSGGASYGYHAVITFTNGSDVWEIYYGHMLTNSSVQYGYRDGGKYQIKAGQPIGQIDSTGNSTGPHLHFELRRNGKFVNPLPYLGLGTEHYPILPGMENYLLE